MNTPNIRFKGFTGDWEQRKLSEETVLIDTGKSKFNKKNSGKYEILGSTSVIGYDDNYDYEGDFLLTARVGANAGELYRHSGQVKISDNTVFIQGEHLDYTYYLLVNFDIKKLSFGTGQPLVKASDLKNLMLLYPNKEERDKIGSYFSTIDNLITLHQRKCDSLKQVKKYMLRKMFPKQGEKVPEIRFDGFTGDWEQRKVENIITDMADGPFGSNLKLEHYTEEKEARIIQLSNLSDYGWQDDNTRYTTFEHAQEIKRCIVHENELVMGKMMPAGMTIMRPNNEKMYVLSSDCVRIKLNNDLVIAQFFLYITKSDVFLNQINSDSQGSTRVRTSISKIRKMDIMLPSVTEQLKIGKYFSNLDNLIALHQRKSDSLKEVKKFMLQNMFPRE